jgi:hypothetical protein
LRFMFLVKLRSHEFQLQYACHAKNENYFFKQKIFW